jgi:hypothetical protein
MVVLRPDRWALVDFDPERVLAIATLAAERAGLSDDVEVIIEVDDSSPLGRSSIDSMDPPLVSLESGALEDPKHPRGLSEEGAAGVLGRLMFRVADRRSEGFADAPPDSDLTLAQLVAWEVYAAGRLARAGHRAQRQRWRYHFRNRHGFNDEADAAFDRLWSAEDLTWADLEALTPASV